MFHVWPGEWHEGRDLGGLATTVLANLTTDLDTDSVLRSGWDKEATASKVTSRYCYWLPPNRTGNEIDGRMWQVMTAYPDEVMLSCLDVSCCSWFTLHSVFPRFPLSCSSKPDKDKFNNLHEHDDNYINYFKILAVRKWRGQVSGSEWAIRGMYAECFVAKQSISRICCCERDSGLLGIICSFKVQPQPAHHHPQAVGNPRLWQRFVSCLGADGICDTTTGLSIELWAKLFQKHAGAFQLSSTTEQEKLALVTLRWYHRPDWIHVRLQIVDIALDSGCHAGLLGLGNAGKAAKPTWSFWGTTVTITSVILRFVAPQSPQAAAIICV